MNSLFIKNLQFVHNFCVDMGIFGGYNVIEEQRVLFKGKTSIEMGYGVIIFLTYSRTFF